MANEEIIIRLIRAAEPFTSSDIVDETSGTIPLMEELGKALLAARDLMGVKAEPYIQLYFRTD